MFVLLWECLMNLLCAQFLLRMKIGTLKYNRGILDTRRFMSPKLLTWKQIHLRSVSMIASEVKWWATKSTVQTKWSGKNILWSDKIQCICYGSKGSMWQQCRPLGQSTILDLWLSDVPACWLWWSLGFSLSTHRENMKFLDTFWMDCNEFCYRHSGFTQD